MKTLKLFIILLVVILISTSSYALFDSDVKKAKEFMQAGMYPQAMELLDKKIQSKPTDVEAHFQLGICYINTDNLKTANERFGSAVRLDSEYGYKIGGEYKRVGYEVLSNGNPNRAMGLYRKAVKYQPNLKGDISQQCFKSGKTYLNQGNSKTADRLFAMSVNYDASLQKDINAVTQDYGQKMLATAKEKPKKERRKYVDEALKYLTHKDVDQVLQPPHWVKVPKSYVEIQGLGIDTEVEGGAHFTYRKGWMLVAKTSPNVTFKHYKSGRFREFTGGTKTKCKQTFTLGKRGFGFKIPKGEVLRFWAEKLETSY